MQTNNNSEAHLIGYREAKISSVVARIICVVALWLAVLHWQHYTN